jgi:nitrate reductase NapAB chaperone NapD
MSQLLDIDFAAPNPLAYQRLTVTGLVLMVFTLLLCAYVWAEYQKTEQMLVETEATLNTLAPAEKAVPVQSVVETASEAEIQYARAIVTQLSTPWNPLLNALERINMQNVALLSVEPNRKKQQLVITGQAKNMESTLSYIKRLEEVEGLSQVYLLKHQIDQSDPNKPVGFTILAQWTI